MSSKSPWWKDATLYQIYPLSFMDANGDGLGDLRGIISKLDYLRDLGIDGTWISPFYTSPLEYDYGYGPADLTSINPLFGTMDDFDTLVREAHNRGIKVILEWAVTNTSVFGSWFRESKSSRTNPKADWYLWSDTIPNNWCCFTGGSSWHYCPERNQYYLGVFFREHAEINWRNPAVKQAVLDAFEFWLKRGIDGYRLDTVTMYVKDKDLRDNPPRTPDATIFFDADDPIHKSKYLQNFIPDIHKYDMKYVGNAPECFDIMREMRQICDRYSPDILLLGETDVVTDTSKKLCASGMTVANNFALLYTPWGKFRDTLRKEHDLLNANMAVNTFSNHDISRAISRHATGDPEETRRRAKVLAAMILTLKGVPMIYYGEELGMLDAVIPRSELRDPMGRAWHYLKGATGLSRDCARSPMLWTGGRNAGFTSDRPWIRLSGDYESTNVAAQTSVEGSMLETYRALIRLRRDTPALRQGDHALIDAVPADCLAYARTLDGIRVVVLINMANRPLEVALGDLGVVEGWRELYRMYPGECAAKSDKKRIMLSRYDVVVLQIL